MIITSDSFVRIISLLKEVFHSESASLDWLQQKNPYLNQNTPLDMILSGKEKSVESLLSLLLQGKGNPQA